jgi:transposase
VIDFDALSRDELIDLFKQQLELNLHLQDQVAALEAEVERLRKDPPSGVARAVPSFVKPNRALKEKKERKKRPRSYVRHREKPTRVVNHTPDRCPDCQRKLSGGWVHRVRQVIEIPVSSYEVIEHRMWRRWCGVCKKMHVASLDVSGEVVGRHRVGIRLMSLLVTLKNGCRMTVSGIQRILGSLYGLHLSQGEVSEILHAVARRGRRLYDQLGEAVRGSPYVHADETSWREDGKNHWLWSFSTRDVRLFVEDASRSHLVPERVLGERYPGILCSDFLGAYNYHLGVHQRCWVHYLRDIKKLGEDHPDDLALATWTRAVADVYSRAKQFTSPDRRTRIRTREAFQEELLALARMPFINNAPQRILAERIERFAQEMFTFVEHPDVPADNNPAERAIRPAVTNRKVTGGTRSPQGSETFSILMSLVGTWMLRKQDPFLQCQQMLATP